MWCCFYSDQICRGIWIIFFGGDESRLGNSDQSNSYPWEAVIWASKSSPFWTFFRVIDLSTEFPLFWEQLPYFHNYSAVFLHIQNLFRRRFWNKGEVLRSRWLFLGKKGTIWTTIPHARWSNHEGLSWIIDLDCPWDFESASHWRADFALQWQKDTRGVYGTVEFLDRAFLPLILSHNP